jgi:hypothetical protein
MYDEEETNASDACSRARKTTRSEVKPGFLSTTPSRGGTASGAGIPRGYGLLKEEAPTIESTPMRASATKRPRHEV